MSKESGCGRPRVLCPLRCIAADIGYAVSRQRNPWHPRLAQRNRGRSSSDSQPSNVQREPHDSHHLGSAHCVRAEPMGAPYNCGTRTRARVPLPPLPHRNFPCRPPGRSGHRRYTAKMRTSFGHAQGPSACALAGAALSLASPPSPSKGGANAWRNGRTIWIVDAHRDDG